ncbi:efflux RND transporter periplasmic adaptor subunit [Opitutus sp. ER46]|uniref:efflux RND transporter periplasmic adaptor subunit n=1 Tax=Opitutus sp. ER46 TaxID=2161864 RepID=UPI000D318F6D|nr:efflux RND transporter periplasmic adaptor subunit [Opitutus sp. ER46]PTX90778.1 efflux transporter periplasmic adaptor subunit [Opitutus sp. ER46]
MNAETTTPSVRPHPPRRRRLLFAVAGLLLAGSFTGYVAIHASPSGDAAPATPPPAPKVTVAPVEQKVITQFEEITGRVDAVETVDLRARVSGHLEAVAFQAGQLVKQGDVLFRIDPRWYRAQFELATARVDEARAHAESADREAHRAEGLLKAAAISNEEADARRSRALEARAALASATAALATAQLDLEHTEVRAPIAGRISRAYVTQGNLVSGSPGNATLLATLVSVGDAYVYADLDEATVLKFNRLARENRLPTENGRIPVELQLADEAGYPRRGYIESADNRLNAATGSLVLRLVFSNQDNALLPGLFARVRIPVSAPERALLISERAVGTDQGQKYVLALQADNTVAYRTVQLGAAIEGKRIVRDGLRPGDRIVVNGLQRVRPGMTVSPELVAAAPTPAPVANASATRVAVR